MDIKVKSIKEVGSCGFCQRGQGDWEKVNNYPYTHIYEVEGNSIIFRMCEDCVREFVQKMLDLPVLEKGE